MAYLCVHPAGKAVLWPRQAGALFDEVAGDEEQAEDAALLAERAAALARHFGLHGLCDDDGAVRVRDNDDVATLPLDDALQLAAHDAGIVIQRGGGGIGGADAAGQVRAEGGVAPRGEQGDERIIRGGRVPSAVDEENGGHGGAGLAGGQVWACGLDKVGGRRGCGEGRRANAECADAVGADLGAGDAAFGGRASWWSKSGCRGGCSGHC